MRLFRRRRDERPCPLCSKPVSRAAERCDACGRRFKAMTQPLLMPVPTGLELSQSALESLARRT
ncbi:MAG TPA: hypothetical protein VIM86_12090 [Thermodesulfobacteriota bacterium]